MAGMTSNEHLSVLLSCYLDGELTPDELDIVVDVLENDLSAIAEFRQLQASRRAVRTLPTLNVPLELMPGGHLDEELSAYLDGELDTIELPAATSHLADCAECRAELADLDRSRTAVRALPGLEPPAFLSVARTQAEDRKKRRWPGVAVVGSVAAAVLAVTFVVTSNDVQPASIDVADLQSRHAAVASVPSGATGLQVSSP
ncbi:MAG: anti-sigma factor family protein [Acidimicrobiia bacterium]